MKFFNCIVFIFFLFVSCSLSDSPADKIVIISRDSNKKIEITDQSKIKVFEDCLKQCKISDGPYKPGPYCEVEIYHNNKISNSLVISVYEISNKNKGTKYKTNDCINKFLFDQLGEEKYDFSEE